MLDAGKACKQIASELGVTQRTVEKWRKASRDGTQHVRQKAGVSARLSGRQMQQLARKLKGGAYAHGYAEDYWTLDRIAHLIWTLFGVRYHPSGVWHLMRRMGWSNQKPKRQALQRDDVEIARWQSQEWPRIKKVSATSRHSGV